MAMAMIIIRIRMKIQYYCVIICHRRQNRHGRRRINVAIVVIVQFRLPRSTELCI